MNGAYKTYGGLQLRVWDGKRYGTGSAERPEHRSRSLMTKAQVADAPRTVPEIAPLSRTPICHTIYMDHSTIEYNDIVL